MSEYRRIPVRGSKEIYYADLMAPAEAFSNEWDKYLLLNILNEFRSVYEFELYAFCILNDRLMLLAGSYRLKASTVRSMLSGLAERYLLRTEQIGEYGLLWPGPETRAGIVRIDDEQDAISVMRYIHLMPASQGYSLSAADYWWYFAHFGRFFLRIYTLQNTKNPVNTVLFPFGKNIRRFAVVYAQGTGCAHAFRRIYTDIST